SGWFLITLCCLAQSRAFFWDISSPKESELRERLIRLMQRLRLEEDFNTLLVYGSDCIFHSLLIPLRLPVVIVASSSTNYDWNFSSSTFILTCTSSAELEENAETLRKLQLNRRLIAIEEDIQPESVCGKYNLNEQPNIAMVKSTFYQSDVIYSCRFFQSPNYEEVNFFGDKAIYIENFLNMQGASIRTVPHLMPPRTIIHRDKVTNELKMLGYLSHVLNTYAEKVNATLDILDVSNLGLKRRATFLDIAQFAKENLLDIGGGLGSSLQHNNLDTITYPYLLTGYCLMIPVPANVPYSVVYSMIVDPVVLSIIFAMFCAFSILIMYTQSLSWRDLSLTNVLLNDKSLRGLLGQSFPFPQNPSKHLKLIIFLLCFASTMITTMYGSYLQSFFARPPSEPSIKDFSAVGNLSHRMALSRYEMNVLIATNNTHFHEMNLDDLVVFDDFADYMYLRLRDDMNVSYGWTVAENRWRVYAEQQKFFKEPLFYFSKDLCFSHMVLQSIPLRLTLPSQHIFQDHIMRQHEFGLVQHWERRGFFDMVTLGLTQIKDLSHPMVYDATLAFEDISWIMKLYLIAMALNVMCFLIEVSPKSWRVEKYSNIRLKFQR
ncbi:hypothetical protein KR018_010370, partial [Drosophila ironensis]